MDIPSDYFFTDEHEWAWESSDGVARIGITEYAQDMLGDVIFVEFPEIGESFDARDVFGIVESVKAASDLYLPVAGEVVEVNDELHDAPELVNEEPYEGGWMIEVEMEDPGDFDDLMDAEAYEEFVDEQEG